MSLYPDSLISHVLPNWMTLDRTGIPISMRIIGNKRSHTLGAIISFTRYLITSGGTKLRAVNAAIPIRPIVRRRAWDLRNGKSFLIRSIVMPLKSPQ